MKVNWINSWKSYNKKSKYRLGFRLGKVTVLEIEYCPCDMCDTKTTCSKFRFMIFNLGFEI